MLKIRLVLLPLIFLCLACKEQRRHPVQFYHWKSTPHIGNTEKRFFEELGSEKLYLRLFDVDLENGRPQPQAIIRSFDANALNAGYIPVVFITNRTISGTSARDIEKLAEDVYSLIRKIVRENRLGHPGEIQIDCDWTSTTSDRFFHFLKFLKNISGKRVSCTLRLHQVKYRKQTGIPPVEKVYLMAYATSNPQDNDGKNSILDLPLLKDYLENIREYPLDLDVALPLYSWAVVTNHLGKTKLINGVTENELQASVYTKTGEHTYLVREDTFLHGIYLNRGFVVRTEAITPELLQSARDYLDRKISRPHEWVYYHLDSLFLERFTYNDLK
ncbi:hypothetical protein [Sinomicrobium weinanense]|uniref:Uncharacterized protein n=1 Tax=Sinomicrobium weinanense TaxID=2842200 RepID=A0A926JRP2_9FLAO|nr:hypothetical protein [Sinomicrobium weinanense]MBC9796141.1 hypothetical protein [Sinomicrobium weinanense]MBU3121892.1 hypothetical protein [Sinomicrobium weinanense]